MDDAWDMTIIGWLLVIALLVLGWCSVLAPCTGDYPAEHGSPCRDGSTLTVLNGVALCLCHKGAR